MKYQQINTLIGWSLCIVSTIIYLLCCSTSVGFWDSGEFITTSSTLQIGHAPGAPVYQLFSHLFSLFSFHNPKAIAYSIHAFSAFASGFTVLFLYWTCTRLFYKLKNDSSLTTATHVAVMTSASVTALVFAFSDTFWRSAMEAEVYSLASFFIIFLFWCMLRYKDERNPNQARRELLFFVYMAGLSVGVHFLCLLVIPAFMFLLYFQNERKPFTIKNGCIALGISFIGFLLVYLVILPLPLILLQQGELFFVNILHTKQHIGSIIILILMIGGLSIGSFVLQKRNKQKKAFYLLLGCLFITGYSSYSIIIIRSHAQVPVNENAPDDVFRLSTYLSRDGYEKPPLLFGPVYTARADSITPPKPSLIKKHKVSDRLHIPLQVFLDKTEAESFAKINKGSSIRLFYDTLQRGIMGKPHYPSFYYSFFPRMYNTAHAENYQLWTGIPQKTGIVEGEERVKPSLLQQAIFFFKYQLGYMYFRYLMWNFSGRFGDIQGKGDWQEGQWVSGIPFLDSLLTGCSHSSIPPSLQSKARHHYFLIPFLLGIVGFLVLWKKHTKEACLLTFLFLMTGPALTLYLNESAYQPRERDYIYVGSFLFFSIAMGIGFLSLLSTLLKTKLLKTQYILFICILGGFGLCFLVFWQNKKDHIGNESFARELAAAYLESCPPNAILFCKTDNETFPLWYAQEVEKIRTDVRIVNLNLLSFDWYIDQCKQKTGNAEALPISFSKETYAGERLPYASIIPESDLMEYSSLIPSLMKKGHILASYLYMSVDMRGNNDTCFWKLPSSYILYKNEIIFYDILSNTINLRPLCFIEKNEAMGLHDFLILDGMIYQLHFDTHSEKINSLSGYEKMMHHFSWSSGKNKKNLYADEINRRNSNLLCRKGIMLAEKLMEESKKDSAIHILDYMLNTFPPGPLLSDSLVFYFAKNYYLGNDTVKANSLFIPLLHSIYEKTHYYTIMNTKLEGYFDWEIEEQLYLLMQCKQFSMQQQDPDFEKRINSLFEKIKTDFHLFYNRISQTGNEKTIINELTNLFTYQIHP